MDFPFWQSFLICASGGILGVLFTIPLRRAMVTTSDLPYPEGVAAAEVLEVGEAARSQAGAESREGLLAVVWGAAASAGLAILAATRIATAEFTRFFLLGGSAASGIDMGYSLALVGAGYLVGLSVGMAMLVGLLISWAGFVPYLTSLHPVTGSLDAYADHIWRTQVRFIGAGAIAVASIWTLLKLIGPVVSGVVSTLSASRAAKAGEGDLRDTESVAGLDRRDYAGLPGGDRLAALPVPRADAAGIRHDMADRRAIPFIFVGGFLIAAICGYMAGLIGASNSPISGVGILPFC